MDDESYRIIVGVLAGTAIGMFMWVGVVVLTHLLMR